METFEQSWEKPPNFEQIEANFDLKGNEIFAWDGIVYNPYRIQLNGALLAHENVHFEQQKAEGPQKWWDRYCEDPKFRISQEIPAHRAEFAHIKKFVKDRELKRLYLDEIARRLSGPLYGNQISFKEARKLIRRR